MAKNNKTTNTKAATVIAADFALRPTADITFDIETAPLKIDAEAAALRDPLTSRVAAIGYYEPHEARYLIAYDEDEGGMLRQFWECFLCAQAAGIKMVGFNSFAFDLPFIVRRSWGNGVRVPSNIMTYGGRYWNECFIDLMQAWKCGEWKCFISLDALSRFLGVGQKIGDGIFFHQMWVTNRDEAIAYLSNDVLITALCGQKMGLMA
jgi:hypothetical protein